MILVKLIFQKIKLNLSFLKLTIKKFVETLIFRLINNKNILDKCNNVVKRNEIATIIFSYLDTISKESYINEVERIKGTYTKNNFKKFFNNYLINVANSLASATLDMLSTTISNALGMQSFLSDKEHKYIKSLKIDNLEDISSYSDIKLIFDKLISLIRELGFTTITIFVDRVDEYSELENFPIKISEFIHPISGNTVLTNDTRFSFQFLLWDKLKEPMAKLGVRFDKVTQISIDLKVEELENIMKERLKYYSSGKITNLESIIDIKPSLIFELADSSPRNMFRLLFTVYNLQEDSAIENINRITENAFEDGFNDYIYEYNFYYDYPMNSNQEKFTVYEFIGNLYALKKTYFTIKEYTEACHLTPAQTKKQIEKMLEMNVISRLMSEGEYKYQVVSKLLTYAINRNKNIKGINSI
ncbi:hypothetical protein Sdiek2_1821 [Sulfurospirillum diekertiae]|nr:hypothetical protein Sdiek2_1821 [Sulfurospirillum diekertiae]